MVHRTKLQNNIYKLLSCVIKTVVPKKAQGQLQIWQSPL